MSCGDFPDRVTIADEAARKLLGDREAIGATGWQAAKLLGLSTQVAPVEVLATTGRPPAGLRNVILAGTT